MLYSSAGLLALIVNLIINHDVLRRVPREKLSRYQRTYRAFLMAVTVYYVTDIGWGFLYEHQLITLCFLDTAVYFFAMGCTILLWTRYVVAYLQENTLFGKLLKGFGWLFFAFELIVLVINFFRPILFSFDEAGGYHAHSARYVTLVIQIIMFLMTAVYALLMATAGSETMRFRHRTIGLFSLAMAGFVTGQAFFPLLPLYAIGCMLGGCVLHSFVLENEKEEYRGNLELQLQENIQKGNYYDLLTGLPGMTYFFELAERRREEMLGSGGSPAFLFLDLSGLKFYNHKHGFSAGDRLLQAFAQILVSRFGEENCSRFGQDHFAVFTREEGLEDTLAQMFRDWEARDIDDCPAIRVGVYPDRMERVNISTACDRAKAARDSIRNTYLSTVKYFDAPMLEEAEKRQYIISHLDRALEEQWIQVYYQPIIRAANGQVCDEEALARWIDPERGFLSPAEFIPILEEADLIYKLDLYVVDQILEKVRRMEDAGLFLVPQSVNLSRADFDSCDIVEEIRRRVDDAGLPHRLLSIEITESIIGSDMEFIKSQIERFRTLGFPVWMDDFGSGYSSLDVLSTIPVDLIKFDMRFMQQFDHGDKSKIVLAELMKLAIGLGIDTVCEGVERGDQVDFLRDIGCAKLQGFYFTKPLPLAQVLERYQNGTQIGFENPEESGYYDAIGRVNLYDLSIISQEEEDAFRNYFSTIPMAIIEVRGNKARFTRSNQEYRDFMERTFRFSLNGLDGSFEETPEGPGYPFVLMLRQCCREGGRAVFDEAMPDGTVVHSFMRRLADNQRTGTTAAVVAVLAVSNRD